MMPTTREFLGDSLIKELEGAGFSPQSINAFAKNEYRQRKAAQEEEQRRLLYRADDMKLDGKIREALLSGDINEEEAKNAQKFEEFGSKKHGWGLGAAKTLTGIANTAERVSDFINPFYEGKHDENGNYIYQNSIEQALRPKIQNAQKLRDDYEKATGETAWGSRLAEIGTEMVGDPVNFIGGAGLLSKGSKLAQFGKKTLFFAGTGAASGGVMALGEGKNDEETLKNIGYGAAGGFVLGHAIDQGIQGISKLIAKRQASRVANEADAIESAQNSEFLDGGNSASGYGVGAELKEAQTMTARDFATKEAGLDEVTAKKVVKEAMQGKEKSDWTDADTYADIAKFKNFEIQRDYAKAYSERIQTAQASINNAREQSAIRYADTQKAINEYQKQGMSPSAARELINAKFKPSADEINYTRAYNDGSDVDARLAGQGIFYALEKDIAAQTYTPEIYATRLKQRGFSDESVQAFTQAYINKDINIAKDYANSKVAQVYENKIQREVANEIRDRDEVGGGFVNEEAKNNGLSDSVSDIGDNASRTGERQGDDEEILRKGGRNTSSTSQTKRTAQSDEQMEQQPAFKTDGDTDATAASKQMVEEQGSGDNEIRGDNFITKESPEPKSDLNVKMDLAPNVRDLSKITTDEISADLDYLANKHPEMFKKPSDVFKLVREIKNEPTHFFNNNRLDYALIVKRVGDNKIGKLAVDKESGEVKHATKVKEKDIKRLDRISRENSKDTGIIQTFIQPGSKSNSELRLPSEIIPKQTQEEYKKLVNEYDVDKFLSDRENVLSKDARHGKNRITDRTIESNDGVGGWEYKLTPAGYEKNYKADFLTTKADVAKIRAGKMDEATFNKLKSDLESSDALGYEYKKGSEYADMEDFEREFGSLYNPKGSININANSHIASGLVAGTLNSIDEDGNFNPNRFAAGFLVGLVGSKAAVVALKKVAPKFYDNLMNTAKGFSNKGIKEIRNEIEKINGIVPIKEFGENYAEFYHNGEGAVQKLLAEKQGQVAGAFYRKELGDIDLVWGKVWQDQKGTLQGYGLAKIKAKHPEITAENLDDVIKNGQTKIRQNEAIQIEKDGYKVVLKNNWMGEKTPNKWIVTAYEKERKVSSISSDTFTKGDNHPLTSNEIIPQQIKVGVKSTTPSDSIQGSAAKSPIEHSLDDTVRSSGGLKPIEHSSDGKDIIQQNEEKVYYGRNIEEIKREHPNVEKELDESIVAMKEESFNDSNFKDDLISKFDKKEIATQQLGKSVKLSNKQLAALKNDIKNADFKVISDSKIYFDKIGKDGDKKRFFIDIAEDGNIRVDAYAKSQIDNMPIKENALQELAGVGDRARLKNMSFEVKAAYRNELDPIKKEAILKTAELNKLKKEAQGGGKVAVAKFEEFKSKNVDKDGNIKDGLRLC
ncbi:putative barnase/colicin E5 family endoribonuclease [Campylobacter concisus]